MDFKKPAIERRVMRAMRDGAAYRIAEALADGQPVNNDDLVKFRSYRQQHRDIMSELFKNHPSTGRKSE